MSTNLKLGIIMGIMFSVLTQCNPDAKRLFDDLLSSYNKLVRPVINVTDAVTVKFKLKLSQLIDVVRTEVELSPADRLRCCCSRT